MNHQDLINKFEYDMVKRGRFKRFLLSLDQTLNVIFWNGSQDETVSSHLYRRISNKKATWFDKLLCIGLRKIDSRHCKKSLGE